MYRTGVIENEDIPLGDRVNMCYSSTTLCKGRGKGKIIIDRKKNKAMKLTLYL
jgi:magnesium-transporting ATPase (P-type)